jgi:shikimate dehydrogenase
MGAPAADAILPLDPSLLREGHVVVDLVYEPVETGLLAAARTAGARTVDGVGMLVHQAAHAFTLWTGVDAPVPEMDRAAREAITRKT